MTSNHPSDVISHEVTAVQFSWFDAATIRKLSVKRITSPHIYDNLKNPIPNGLYDLALGNLDKFATCITCGRSSLQCNGHIGHIELSVPIYHPMLFALLQRLLKGKCMVCHHFRCPKQRLKFTLTKLKLISVGMLMTAKAVAEIEQSAMLVGTQKGRGAALKERAMNDKMLETSQIDAATSHKLQQEAYEQEADQGAENVSETDRRASAAGDAIIAEFEFNQANNIDVSAEGNVEDEPMAAQTQAQQVERMLAYLDRCIGIADARAARLQKIPASHRPGPTAIEHQEHKAVLSQFYKQLQTNRCSHCHGFSPRLKKDGHSKIFRLPLTKQQRDAMRVLNLKYPNVFHEPDMLPQRSKTHSLSMNGHNGHHHHSNSHTSTGVDDAALNEQVMKAYEKQLGQNGGGGNLVNAVNNAGKAKPKPNNKKSSAAMNGDAADSGASDVDSEDDSSSTVKRRKMAAKERQQQQSQEDNDDHIQNRVRPRGHEAAAEEEEEAVGKQVLMFPSEVERHVQLLFQRESEILKQIIGTVTRKRHIQSMFGVNPLSKQSTATGHDATSNDFMEKYSMFFLRTLVVPPPRFRPPTQMADMMVDHAQNVYFKRIIENDQRIQLFAKGVVQQKMNGITTADNIDNEEADAEAAPAKQPINMHQVIDAWLTLQNDVNMLLDNSKGNTSLQEVPNGIRQVLEKKEGLFRQHMMGKRVNYAARSVISPDPFLSTREIGVPERFATELTFPEPVTTFNIERLRQAVINGPDVHPGANYVEDEAGNLVNLAFKSPYQRQAIAKTLLTSSQHQSRQNESLTITSAAPINTSKRVYRHLMNGDSVLMNRQPSLHKPSMMAHTVRVMKGKHWQTLRMQYANCDAYNADFDGDEMNMHFPQNHQAQAELRHIANNDNQYLVPTDGSPLRGLIQDHVASGVLITQVDRLMNKQEFTQLLFACMDDVDASRNTVRITIPTPTILKPRELWTGKQLVSTVLKLLTGGYPALNMKGKAKVPAQQWNQHREEQTVIFRQSDLLCGVLDKSSFGASSYGIVHACYELYGARLAGDLLSILSRLFTIDLQNQGHTCGIDDMLLIASSENNRKQLIDEAMVSGIQAARKFADLDDTEASMSDENNTGNDSELQDALRQRLATDTLNRAKLDGVMKGTMNQYTSSIIAACLPIGQIKPFPENMMARMILTGAKGSMVNFSQICCLLGQQELEGRRVPMMPTGRTLPSFRKYDASPRAGGYIANRFLTGIQPQEYFLHCQAGREGLIDTAVKTARSGYLQRCLIKHLESLVVGYDYTVRDSDQSVVQFHYGEDSIDITKASYLEKFDFLASNYYAILHKLNPSDMLQKMEIDAVDQWYENQREAIQATSDITETHMSGDTVVPEAVATHSEDPVMSIFSPGRYLGSTSESFKAAHERYFYDDPDQLFRPLYEDQQLDPKKHLSEDRFNAIMKMYYTRSLVQPGENVGILAAQSVGEPSTQMTLNTFHLAGHGGANVTLGIPRLREIVMTAAHTISTPIMEIPLLPHITKPEADKIVASLNRLQLADFLKDATVAETIDMGTHSGAVLRTYRVQLQYTGIRDASFVRNQLRIADFKQATDTLAIQLNAYVVKQVKSAAQRGGGQAIVKAKASRSDDTVDESGMLIDEGENAEQASMRQKKTEGQGYDEPDSDDEREMRRQDRLQQQDEEGEAPAVGMKRGRSGSEAGNDDHIEDLTQQDGDSDEPVGGDNIVHSRVTEKCPYIVECQYNATTNAATIIIGVPVAVPKLLLMSQLETMTDNTLLRATPKITGCRIIEKFAKDGSGKYSVVQTDGVNFNAIWHRSDVFDVEKIYSNDIAAIMKTYGIEAARACISSEVNAVFNVYGISVDYRHLALIADYMTNMGDFRPMNRIGLANNDSIFQKVSFETSMQFILNACMGAEKDPLTSPSSRIVMGQPVKVGTGSFALRYPVQTVA